MSSIRKLDARWLGPYRISSKEPSQPDRGTYRLEDLDGTLFRHTTPGWRLKVFRERSQHNIALEERGTSKLWEQALWNNTQIFRPPPAQFDDSNAPDDSNPDSSGISMRNFNLRDAPSRDPASTTRLVPAKPHGQTTVQVVPRVITDEERALYTRPTYNVSDTDSEASSNEDD
ncbi:hypothetical protein EJ02DRAFT_475368 [Clathrospora elynae]|uniref:Uncharacterized protein n=1 Tax=Clathrospora elynae TaxID=706981 RepID=A0A6A5SBA9_9PLEO|nr:hypothetical protein EJ02DRAFT_475368 [Clathrospora elynae]